MTLFLTFSTNHLDYLTLKEEKEEAEAERGASERTLEEEEEKELHAPQQMGVEGGWMDGRRE